MSTENGANGATTEEKKELTPEEKAARKAELKARFADYEAAEAAVEEAKKNVTAKELAVSDAVKRIGEMGPGPYGYKGDEVTVCVRGDTAYFRGKKKERVIETI